MSELGLNRRLVRAIYPKVDWDEYDREVIEEWKRQWKRERRHRPAPRGFRPMQDGIDYDSSEQ